MRRSGPLAALIVALALAAPAVVGAQDVPRPAPVAAPAPAETLPVVGIAEQQPGMFVSPLFRAARIRHARLLVGWNGIDVPWQRAEIDAWLAAARATGVEPLVTFGRSRTSPQTVPTASRFLRSFRAFRKRYPWVRTYAAWNEANQGVRVIRRRPELVAAYWRGMRLSCPGCTVLPAELLDTPDAAAWALAFRRAARIEPRVWGLHNYVDANRFTTTRTEAVLRAVRGEVWFTETGGVVERDNGSRIEFAGTGTRHAARATGFVFDRLATLSPRVTRVYLYHWADAAGPWTWDSGMVDSRGRARPAYRTLRDRLARMRAAAR